MINLYITFGQTHRHEVNSKVFDKDTVCEIKAEDFTEGRARAFNAFGDKFSTSYFEEQVDDDFMELFPKGIVNLDA